MQRWCQHPPRSLIRVPDYHHQLPHESGECRTLVCLVNSNDITSQTWTLRMTTCSAITCVDINRSKITATLFITTITYRAFLYTTPFFITNGMLLTLELSRGTVLNIEGMAPRTAKSSNGLPSTRIKSAYAPTSITPSFLGYGLFLPVRAINLPLSRVIACKVLKLPNDSPHWVIW